MIRTVLATIGAAALLAIGAVWFLFTALTKARWT